MAMTLRLPDDLDKLLSKVASEQHVSKHALAVEGIRQLLAQEAKNREAVDLTREISAEYAELFTRLEDA